MLRVTIGNLGSFSEDDVVRKRDFGSVAAWRAEFAAMAKAQRGGSGWTILGWSERLGRLINQWAGDHAHGLPGGTSILALDMYEHAYHIDFGAQCGLSHCSKARPKWSVKTWSRT